MLGLSRKGRPARTTTTHGWSHVSPFHGLSSPHTPVAHPPGARVKCSFGYNRRCPNKLIKPVPAPLIAGCLLPAAMQNADTRPCHPALLQISESHAAPAQAKATDASLALKRVTQNWQRLSIVLDQPSLQKSLRIWSHSLGTLPPDKGACNLSSTLASALATCRK